VLALFIVLFSVMGAYSLNNDLHDVYLMILFGFAGYVLSRMDYPVAGLVLGLVLGPLFEHNLRQALAIAHGDWTMFFTRPISGPLMVLALLALFWPAFVFLAKRVRRSWVSADARPVGSRHM